MPRSAANQGHISVKGATYAAMRAYCTAHGISLATLLKRAVLRDLGKERR